MADNKSFDIYGSSRRATPGQVPIDKAISQALTNYGIGVQNRLSGNVQPTTSSARSYIPTPSPSGYVAPAAKPKPIPTPASVAASMAKGAVKPKATNVTINDLLGNAATPPQPAVDPMAQSNAAIESAYNPVLDFYAKQQQQTQDRYAKNLNNQFASSITKQQADLAARTAEQRAAQEAGAAQLAQTGTERGSGPALGGSPTATATEQGIGQAGAIQQNWEGLMGAQQANAVTDIQNRGAGYGQQQIAAQNQMTQNLQDALANIGGQQASIKSQIAQAKVSRDQAIQSNQFDIAAAAQKQIDAMQLQGSKNKGITDVATIRASATLAAKRLGGAGSAKAPKVPASEAIKVRADKLGPTVFQQIQSSAADAYNAAYATLNANPNAKTVKTPTAADVKAAWQAAHRGKATSAPLANDYIDSAYK
jgi:hypothetical protein